ncbi:MAG: hypothetical protein OXI24_12280 [Candidatus Poribacteria bacterium]|nr:hypothetical protein [Candidatus Poribacteria bacterium]
MACLFFLGFAVVVALAAFVFRDYALFIILAAAFFFAWAANRYEGD